MLVEGFLTKIAGAVLKKAAGSLIPSLSNCIGIYSAIDSANEINKIISSINDSNALKVNSLNVASGILTDLAFDKLISSNRHSFNVEKTSSGIYIVSDIVPSFKVNNLSFPTTSSADESQFSYLRAPDGFVRSEHKIVHRKLDKLVQVLPRCPNCRAEEESSSIYFCGLCGLVFCGNCKDMNKNCGCPANHKDFGVLWQEHFGVLGTNTFRTKIDEWGYEYQNGYTKIISGRTRWYKEVTTL